MRREDPKYAKRRQEFMAKQKAMSKDKFSKGGLSPKQKVIAAKAPPPNKITGEDFAVMKKEKVMKARTGSIIRPQGPGVLRPKPTVGGKPLKPKPIKPNKKMGGGMMQKPMGYDDGGSTYEKPILKLKPRVRNARGQNPNRPSGPGRPVASGPRKMNDILNNSNLKKYNVAGSDGSTLIIGLKDTGKKLSGLTPLGGAASAVKKYKDYQDDKKSRNPNPKTPKMYGGGSVSVKTKLGRNKPTKLY